MRRKDEKHARGISRRAFLGVTAASFAAPRWTHAATDSPKPLEFVTIQAGELTAVVGTNAGDATSDHRPGYNGLWSLSSRHESSPLFLPGIAGLNLEHVVDGQIAMNDRKAFFEPRNSPMVLCEVTPSGAMLHQPPTPRTGLESWTRFTLRAPYYIDFEFRCVPRKESSPFDYLACFWASYINGPEDKAIYFLGPSSGGLERWQQFCSQRHNRDATVRQVDDLFEMRFEPGFQDCLFKDTALSEIRFSQPFYYGRFRDMVWIIMFDRAQNLRFTHSPSGGGVTADRHDTNPAWDFQFVIPKVEVGRQYSLRATIAYKRWSGRNDVMEEWSAFSIRGRPQ